MLTPLEKVAEASIWLARHRNLEKAGKLRFEKTVRMAKADGYTITEIAKAADIRRATIYAILDRS